MRRFEITFAVVCLPLREPRRQQCCRVLASHRVERRRFAGLSGTMRLQRSRDAKDRLQELPSVAGITVRAQLAHYDHDVAGVIAPGKH